MFTALMELTERLMKECRNDVDAHLDRGIS